MYENEIPRQTRSGSIPFLLFLLCIWQDIWNWFGLRFRYFILHLRNTYQPLNLGPLLSVEIKAFSFQNWDISLWINVLQNDILWMQCKSTVLWCWNFWIINFSRNNINTYQVVVNIWINIISNIFQLRFLTNVCC